MSGRNGFMTESNGFEPVDHIPRPTAGHAAFKELSPEALQVAQEHYDAAVEAKKQKAERKKRMEEWEQSDEGQQARDEARKLYQQF